MKKILVTGGSGYQGVKLIKKLISAKYKVINIDNNLFGNYFIKHRNVKNYQLDINQIHKINLRNVYGCIHLASIANDPMVDLNQSFSWETSALGTMALMEQLKKYKVKKIIYASSGSVYGIKKEKKVTEDLLPVPISIYNKTKMIAERVLESYQNQIKIHSIRPATVCGYSPRMRLDISVNMFVYQALVKKKLIVFGGKQIRPNINIKDLINVYIHFIKNPQFKSGNYNAGFENLRPQLDDFLFLLGYSIVFSLVKVTSSRKKYHDDVSLAGTRLNLVAHTQLVAG